MFITDFIKMFFKRGCHNFPDSGGTIIDGGAQSDLKI